MIAFKGKPDIFLMSQILKRLYNLRQKQMDITMIEIKLKT
jgi:hypothetical protein